MEEVRHSRFFLTDCGEDEEGGGLYSHRPGFGEHVGVDVHHQVSARRILHDEAHVLAGLEAGEEVDQEGVADAVHRLKDPLLTHEAVQRREVRSGKSDQGSQITSPQGSPSRLMITAKRITAEHHGLDRRM